MSNSNQNSSNINQTVKKNQRYLWLLILGAIGVVSGGVFYANKIIKAKQQAIDIPQFEEEKQLEPDLTGAVSNTFTGRVTSNVITDAQAESKETREALNKVLAQLETIEKRLIDSEKENEELKKRLDDSDRLQGDLIEQVGTIHHNQQTPYPTISEQDYLPQEVGQAASRGKTTATSNYQSQGGVVTLSNPPKINKGGIERKSYEKKGQNLSKGRFYVPSGSFSNAIILEGADANASVTAQTTDTKPMQFKLTGDLHMPSNKRLSKLKGCFVTAATYGDISSERAIVRLKRLSCIIDGKHIDQEVQGHVAFYGKNGIKGTPVMRNGKMLGLAFMSGALSSGGSAASQIGSTQVGLGASRVVGADEVLRSAIGGGVSTAANKLADYYIQRAEQYHPVIPIGSANRVEVVFQEGFWTNFIEDVAEQGDIAIEETLTQGNAAQQQSGLPEGLIRQLGEVKNQTLSDFVTPNQR
ncbi:TrbI/VirB10 family protein [Glaesserella parasuis]|nr:bacterial conjugation TrbI-like family protein [Glaesserella parasuis 174]MCT8756550.1 hypothetical protein [Glaesserella parasuis]MDD2170365.1 hypothetical protein [Glaesserella parasuis]MDO9767929.1 TrbI/VirB10 family protein [Glaesserella parasuis]MDO9922504.1 TrbI/VirB10 family protein [Glaesserella parasuis]